MAPAEPPSVPAIDPVPASPATPELGAGHVATMLHAAGGPAPARSPSQVSFLPLTRFCATCEQRYPADFLVCPRDATPLTDEATSNVDPLIGVLVGETYQIVRVIGEGGMGRVYEARHLRLRERKVAVKTLHADLARNAEIVARFMREAESASSLDHPHVVDVFDVHHLADGTPYLVSEFLEGEELAGYVVGRGPMPPAMAASVARQICSALGAAHARGIVHRDMKPENVYVLRASIEAVASGAGRDLDTKVLDFGISKAGGADRTGLTRTGVIMGTPSYMAPEQARGSHVDHRADIYSVGAVLYYALTGKRPFDSNDPTSTLSMVLTQDPPRLRALDPRIPEALELVVQRAMAKDPNDRFQTMAALERALDAFAHQGRTAPTLVRAASDDALQVHGDTRMARAVSATKLLLGGRTSMPPHAAGAVAVFARPTVIVASVVLGLWLAFSVIAALAGLVRLLHDGEVTLTEGVLLVTGCVFAVLTPLVLYVLHVKRVVWPNTVRAVQLADDLRRTAVAALVAYGGLSIVARVLHTVFLRNSTALASGAWDIALLVASLVAAAGIGGLAPLLRGLRRRSS